MPYGGNYTVFLTEILQITQNKSVGLFLNNKDICSLFVE